MWNQVWEAVRKAKPDINVDQGHLRNDRDGRYKRSMQSLGRVLSSADIIGYRHFKSEGNNDVCHLVAWIQEDYESHGKYMVFKVYFSKKSDPINEIGYRSFKMAEICCFYDGQAPNPGRALSSKEEAIACMKEKSGYYET